MTEGYFKQLAAYAEHRPEEIREEQRNRAIQRVYEETRATRRAVYERWGKMIDPLEVARMDRLERQIVELVGERHWNWLQARYRDTWYEEDWQ